MFSRRSPSQLAGLLLCALVLGGQLSTFVHLALVRHVTCPEHGELIHANDESAPRVASRAGPGVQATDRTVEHHGHDHCLLCIFRRESSLGLSPRCVVSFGAPPLEGVGGELDCRTRSDAVLFRLAPKTSPPV